MKDEIIECVPNVSEGRNSGKIDALVGVVRAVAGVKVLHVDSGYGANRTVITFAGTPEAVIEAAFQLVKKSAELIDMREHKGEHPRFGATDVLPLIPIANISMDKVVQLSRKLGRRIGEELGISVYCYENSASSELRRSLANCRSGEYEGLAKKLQLPDWKPDFGPDQLNERSGAIALGARPFLIAYNVNLATTDVEVAKKIARTIRESGYLLNTTNGKKRIPGELKKLRAIGWFIPEFGMTQVSMNFLDFSITSIADAFDRICVHAKACGVEVSGSELIGLIPLSAILDAGRHYANMQNLENLSEKKLIAVANDNLGLSQLSPFDPASRILEYKLADAAE